MSRVVAVLILVVCLLPLAYGQRAMLVNVQKGEMPNDATATMALATDNPEKPGGVSLKVTFGAGAFGQYNPKLKDWTGFTTMKFFAFNAENKPLDMYLAIRDKQSTDYGTRIDAPFNLKPGANKVSIDLTNLRRTMSAVPVNLTGISQWFIGKGTEGAGGVVYFGDIVLEGAGGGGAAPAAAPVAVAAFPAAAAGAPGKVVVSGTFKIEIDNVTFQAMVAAGMLGGAAAPAAPVAVAPVAPVAVAPAFTAGPGKILLMDTAGGELPNDSSLKMSITDEHAAELGGKNLKITYEADKGWGQGAWGAGATMPTDWRPYNFFRFEAFNPTDKILACYIGMRDNKTGYENRADIPFRLMPGLNKVELPIGAIATNGGGQLDKGKLQQWFMPCDQAVTVYFNNFRLEKE